MNGENDFPPGFGVRALPRRFPAGLLDSTTGQMGNRNAGFKGQKHRYCQLTRFRFRHLFVTFSFVPPPMAFKPRDRQFSTCGVRRIWPRSDTVTDLLGSTGRTFHNLNVLRKGGFRNSRANSRSSVSCLMANGRSSGRYANCFPVQSANHLMPARQSRLREKGRGRFACRRSEK